MRTDDKVREAARIGDVGRLNSLIASKAPIDVKDYDKRVPLHYAGWNGFAAAVQVLLNAKAEVTAKDRYGITPLHLANAGAH